MVTRKKIDESAWLSSPLLEKAKQLAAPEFLQQGIDIAKILHVIGFDEEGLLDAVIYPSLKAQEIHLDTISEVLGESHAKLLKDVLQMGALGKLRNLDERKSHQLENLRKMLLAMVSDVRAVLIILAERLYLLHQSPEKSFVQETLEVYAPLANRLGVGQLKWEMEDLCLRFLKPDIYKKIAAWLASKRQEREVYIEKVIIQLKKMCADGQMQHVEVMGRVKHIYSIYKKMQRKNIDLNNIYDISAVRILVDSITDCYTALSLVHEKWEHIPKEFDDYIAHPKSNGYQSIHTALIGPEGRIIEIQIRTRKMHQESELGVAAHWKYKEGNAANTQSSYEAKIAWLREIMAWQKEIHKGESEIRQKDLFADRVYVFTPTGDVIDLPQGSTPLDFAYHIHSEVGHRCRGAKIAGHIVPLTYQLQTGEQIEILTTKVSKPSRDWINPHAGYLKTNRARIKVQHWFKMQEESLELEKTKESKQLEKKEIVSAIEPKAISKITRSQKDIQISGVGDLLTQIAGCCKPLPGEEIVGYITQGKGISIHKADCKNILHLNPQKQDRILSVSWGKTTQSDYSVDLQLEAQDRQGLLRDITAFFAHEKINVIGTQSYTDKNSDEAHIRMTIVISDAEKLQKIIAGLKKIPNIYHVYRTNE